jgi:uncharacterized membrane protein YeaQ/YmgE (transglycosylase-associated protein family)
MGSLDIGSIHFNLDLLGWIIIGALAGLIAGNMQRGRGFGCLGNIVLGIVGAYVGGWIFAQLGVSQNLGLIGSLIVATIGAAIVLFVADLMFGNSKGGPRRY